MTKWKMALAAPLATVALLIPAATVSGEAQTEPAPLPSCPSAGTYTATVDGAPDKGACRAFVDQMEPASYAIPPGKLFDALKAYLEQSGARGWVPFDIMVAKICDSDGRNCRTGAIETAGVSGTLPPRDALERLLSGTGVAFVQDQTGTFRFPPSKDAPVPGARCLWEKQPANACPAAS